MKRDICSDRMSIWRYGGSYSLLVTRDRELINLPVTSTSLAAAETQNKQTCEPPDTKGTNM